MGPKLLTPQQEESRMNLCADILNNIDTDPGLLDTLTLKGRRFESVEAVRAKATEVLNQLTEADFQHCFQQWKNHMERFIHHEDHWIQWDQWINETIEANGIIGANGTIRFNGIIGANGAIGVNGIIGTGDKGSLRSWGHGVNGIIGVNDIIGVKSALKGTIFESVEAVKAKAMEVLNQLTETDFQHCFQQCKSRMER
ncbi:hypothetical protein NQ318_005135, partial [Aromia moschata]